MPPTSSETLPNMHPTDAANVFNSDTILNSDAILDTDVDPIITETVPQLTNAPMDIAMPPVDAIDECQDCSFNTPDENQCSNSLTTDEAPPAVPIIMPTSPPNLQPTNFRWGSLEGIDFYNSISTVYEEVIHCRRNVLIPSGSIDKAFVSEIARLFQAYANSPSL